MTKVFVCLALVTLFAASLGTGDTSYKKKELVEGCRNETKYNPSRHGPNSKEMKCYEACIMKREGGMTTEGRIVPEKTFPAEMKERLQKKDPAKFERVSNVLKTCAQSANEKNANDLCERARSFHTCKSEKAKDAFSSSGH